MLQISCLACNWQPVLPGPESPTPLFQPKSTADSEGNSAIFKQKIPLLFRYLSFVYFLNTLLVIRYFFVKSTGTSTDSENVIQEFRFWVLHRGPPL
jgi:hypothetical protein